MSSDSLFEPSLSSERMREVVSDASWVQAMLEVEAALARVEARVGLIPEAAAMAIERHCNVGEYDIARIGREAAESANPVVPLLRALREKLGGDAAAYVHRGATSQDIVDTAMMLIAGRAIGLMLDDLGKASACAASLAERHRSTVMPARTLLQQASVTSFGLKAAGWLVAIMEARDSLINTRDSVLAVQLGGAVGTLSAFREHGPEIQARLAQELGLVRPLLPWHSDRRRVAQLASAIAISAGAAGKLALDIVLLAQTEVGEVREGRVSGRGGSSTLPQKQNPVGAIEILAAVRGVNAQAALLLGSMVQEQERAVGAWQAEWPALSGLLRLAGGAIWRMAIVLDSLEVDAGRMRHNLELTGGLIMSEAVTTLLAERTDPITARNLVEAAVTESAEDKLPFKEVLANDAAIAKYLSAGDLAKALDPSNYLGSSSQLIDNALAEYRRRGIGRDTQ